MTTVETTQAGQPSAPQSYLMRDLKDVAARVEQYEIGDICITNNYEAGMDVRILGSAEEVETLTKLRREMDVSRRNFLVIRTNEQLDAGLLVGWMTTPTGQQYVRRERALSMNGSMFGGRLMRWDHIASMKVPVPPLDAQAEQRALLDLSVGWMDLHIANVEKLAQTLQKMRDALAVHITCNGASRKEVKGWMLDMLDSNPMLGRDRADKTQTDTTLAAEGKGLGGNTDGAPESNRPKGP